MKERSESVCSNLSQSLKFDQCLIDEQYEFVSFEQEIEQQLFSVWDDARRHTLLTQSIYETQLNQQHQLQQQNPQHQHKQDGTADNDKFRQTKKSSLRRPAKYRKIPARVSLLQQQQPLQPELAAKEEDDSDTGTEDEHLVSPKNKLAASKRLSRLEPLVAVNVKTTKSGLAPGMEIFCNNYSLKKSKFNKAYQKLKIRSEKIRHISNRSILSKIQTQITSSGVLNTWRAYIALTALQVPQNKLVLPPIHNKKIRVPVMTNKMPPATYSMAVSNEHNSNNVSTPQYFLQTPPNSQSQAQLFHIPPSQQQHTVSNSFITYSDQINPPRMLSNRLRTQLSIASTQLHNQARTHLVALAAAYREERKRIEEDAIRLAESNPDEQRLLIESYLGIGKSKLEV